MSKCYKIMPILCNILYLFVIYLDDGNGQVCISEIVPGSIAHRSGTLKIGDTLLAVNNKSLTDCTRQEASDILQESGDIVTLRMRTSNVAPGTLMHLHIIQ